MRKILFSVLLFTASIASFCTTWTITNSGFTFSPATLTITVGDSVNFSIASMHNAVEVSQATWNANGTTALSGGFSVAFGGGMVLPANLQVGTHYYVCQAHVALNGMKGTIIVQSTSGIKENPAKTNFSVYPNPSKGKFQLEINNFQPVKNYILEVYDLLGNKVFAATRLNQQTSDIIDLSDFPEGIYLIRLYDGTEISDKKVVIE